MNSCCDPMGFFHQIYGSWDEMQKKKYDAIFSYMKHMGIIGTLVDVGSGKKRDYPLPATRLDTDPMLKPDVVASGSHLPFSDHSFDVVLSVDAAHIFGLSELFRVSKSWLIVALTENLWKRVEHRKPDMEFEISTKEKEVVKYGKLHALRRVFINKLFCKYFIHLDDGGVGIAQGNKHLSGFLNKLFQRVYS